MEKYYYKHADGFCQELCKVRNDRTYIGSQFCKNCSFCVEYSIENHCIKCTRIDEATGKTSKLESEHRNFVERISLLEKITEDLSDRIDKLLNKSHKIINESSDPYAEVRAAQDAGKRVQMWDSIRNEWILPEKSGRAYWVFSQPPEDYRVMPERKYIPFTIEDALIFRDRWIRKKSWGDGVITRITSVHSSGFSCGATVIKFTDALIDIEFDNGEPFGKLVES